MLDKFITEARKKYPTDKAIAESIGIAPQNFHKYKKGEKSPSIETLQKWCDMAGINWNYNFEINEKDSKK